ncbi:MAG TPA: hypothetical protein VIE43_05290 [Thermoanaerobaculia bacterium]|nr:hypothetical protein [Thermoanaerobaculia bacterium]
MNHCAFKTIVPLLLIASACASAPPPSPEAQAAAEGDITEAVFRYQFQHNASTLQQSAERYCLTLTDERNPDAAFLRRFEAVRPQVVAAMTCAKGSSGDLFFRVQKLDWQSDAEVWARGGYSEGTVSSITETYLVHRKDGRWTVDGSRRDTLR